MGLEPLEPRVLLTATIHTPSPIDEGTTLSLSASADGGVVQNYGWDLNNDGVYTDASGQTVDLPWSTLQGYGIDDNGNFSVQLQVTYDDASTETDSKSVTVQNVAPTVSIAGPSSVVATGQVMDFTSNAGDPAGVSDPLAYAWSVTLDGQAYAPGVATDGAALSFAPSTAGTYVATLQVDDGDGGVTTSNSVTVDVENQPMAKSGLVAIPKDRFRDASVTATIEGDGPLTYAISGGGPSHATEFTFNSDGTFRYRPQAGFEGSDQFWFTATAVGGGLQSVPGLVTFSVSEELWEQSAKLLASDGAAGDYFGYAVAASGNLAVIGAYLDDDSGGSSGSAYVYCRTYNETTHAWEWQQEAKLTADDAAVSDWFGRALAVSDDVIVVGASQDDDYGGRSGSAYVFRRNTDGPTPQWTQEAKLTAADAAAADEFGVSVSVSGGLIVVGAHYDDDHGSTSGAAYVFAADFDSGSQSWQWTQEAKITPDDGAATDRFGYAVSVSGETAIIGSYLDDDQGGNSGSAYIYRRSFDGSAWQWSQEAKLTADDGTGGDQFGWAVALSGDAAVVGSPYDDDAGGSSGSAYLFRRSFNSGSGQWQWQQEAKITAADAAAGDRFGYAVAISDDMAIVGAYLDDDSFTNSGSAYAFADNGAGAWNQIDKLAADDAAGADYFGFAVAISNTTAVIGSYLDDDTGGGSGSTYEINRRFQFGDQPLSTDQDTVLPGTLIGADPTNPSLSYLVTEAPTQGVLQLHPDGTFSYDPNDQFDHLITGESAIQSFRYAVQDAGGETVTGRVTITINGVIDAPVVQASTFILRENAVNGEAIGTASATDPDANDTLTYSIVAGNGDGVFAIDSNTGQITVADMTPVNPVATPSYTLTVQASDGTLSATGDVQVRVLSNLTQRIDVNVTAEQSSDYSSYYPASKAIDNDPVEMALTNNQFYNWWMLDLGEESLIEVLHFAKPSHSGRLGNSYVMIASTPFPQAMSAAGLTAARAHADWEAYIPNEAIVDDFSFTAGFIGRYVFVQLNERNFSGGGQLRLNEVSVLGTLNAVPIALGDSYNVDEDSTLSVIVDHGVLDNDTDNDADTLTTDLVTGPSHAAPGAFTLNADGSFDYAPEADFIGTDSFTYRAFDGTAYSDPVTVTLAVQPINDSPAVQLPTTQSTDEDTALVFASSNGNAIVLADVDADAGELALTLSVTQGVLTLSQVIGLTFTAGDGTSNASVAMTGSLADLNAAIEGLTFDPNANYAGAATLTVSLNDQGNSGSGGALLSGGDVAITVQAVNDAPQVTTNQPLSLDEGVAATLTAAHLASVDLEQLLATELVYTLTSVPTAGELRLNSAPLILNSTFTQADIDAGALTYAHDGSETAADSFAFTVSDGTDSVADVFGVTVNPVNDAPAVEAAGPAGVGPWHEGDLLSFTSTVTDADGTSPAYAWSVLKGTAPYAPGVATDQPAFAFSPTDSGSYEITVTVTDEGGEDATSTPITVTVINGAPQLSDIGTGTDENVTYTFTAGDFTGRYTDPGGDAMTAVRIDALPLPAAGVLKLDGAPVAGGQVVLLSELGTLTFEPTLDFVGTASFQWNATDGMDYAASSAQASIIVGNFAPSLVLTGGTTAFVENASPIHIATATVTDVEGNWATGSFAVRITANAEADDRLSIEQVGLITLSGSDVSYSGVVLGTASATTASGSETLTVTLNANATSSAVQALVQAIAFASVSDDPLTLDRTVTFTVTDQANDSASANQTVTVTASNDAPTGVTLTPSTVDENVSGVAVGTLSVIDPDAADAHTVQISNDPTGKFQIVGNQLWLKHDQSIDRETDGDSVTVQVRATDTGGLTVESSLVLTVADANDRPILEDQAFTVTESGTVVGTVVVANAGQDPTETLTYSIPGGHSTFAIDPATGQITVVGALDWTTTSGYTLTVEVTDDSAVPLIDTAQIVIGVDPSDRFDDPDLLNAIRQSLYLTPGAIPTHAQVTGLATLYGDSLLIDDLTGIDELTGLTELIFTPTDYAQSGALTDVASLADLSSLTSLQSLSLQGLGLTAADLPSLGTPDSVVTLDLRYNDIAELNDSATIYLDVAGFAALRELKLYGNAVADHTTSLNHLLPLRGRMVMVDLVPNDPTRARTIHELAAAFHFLPIPMYEWVVNSIAFEAYEGSMKGAQATLDTRAGNHWDTAALMAELLIASGVSAANVDYLSGRISVTPQVARQVVGTEDWRSAGDILASAGLSSEADDPTSPTYVEYDHAWLELRETRPGAGTLTFTLSPSWKLVNDDSWVDMLTLVPFDELGYLNQYPGEYTDTADNTDYARYRDERLELTSEFYIKQVRDYLAAHPELGDLSEVMYDPTIVPQVIDWDALDRGPAYGVTSQTNHGSTIPADRFHTVQIEVEANDTPRFDYTETDVIGNGAGSNGHYVMHFRDNTSRFSTSVRNRGFVVAFFGTVNGGAEGWWYYDGGYKSFTPAASDRIVAGIVDHAGDEFEYFEGVTGSVQSIDLGYFSGNISIAKSGNNDIRVDGDRYYLIEDTASVLFTDTQRRISDIALHRIHLAYHGADDESLAAHLYLGETSVLQTSADLIGGTPVSMTVTITAPDVDGSQTVTFGGREVGEFLSLGLDANQISRRYLADITELVNEATFEYLNGGEAFTGDAHEEQLVGGFLNLAAMKYFFDANEAEALIASLTGAQRHLNYVAAGVTNAQATMQAPDYNLQFPVLPSVLKLDVPRGWWVARGLQTNDASADERYRMLGFTASAMEHAIWEDLAHTPSISTIKALQLANADPTNAILVFDGTAGLTESYVKSQLNLADVIEDAIWDQVNSGAIVTTPKNNTDIREWKGVGYLAQGVGYTLYGIHGGIGEIEEAHGGFGTGDATPVDITAADSGSRFQPAWGDPVNVATGAVYHEESDFSVPNLGVPLTFSRRYDSAITHDASGADNAGTGMGQGWAFSFGDRLHTVAAGDPRYPTFNAGDVIWVTPEGGSLRFESDGGTFTPPSGYFGTFEAITGGHRWTDTAGMRYEFDSNGYLVQVLDRHGNGVTVVRDATDGSRIDQVHDVHDATRKLDYTYNANDLLESVTDAIGRRWLFAYTLQNGQHRLTSVTAPSDADTAQAVVSYTYYTDSARDGLLHQVTQPDGGKTTYEYYANRRGFRVTDAEGHSHSFQFNLFRRHTSFTNEEGYTTTSIYNGNGNLIETRHADGMVELQEWTDNRLTSLTDTSGATQRFEYDSNGNMTKHTAADGVVTENEYNGAYAADMARSVANSDELPSVAIDEQMTEYVYDLSVANGGDDNSATLDQKKVLADDGVTWLVTSYTYDALGRVTSVTSPRGNETLGVGGDYQTTFTYNDAGQMLTETTWVSDTQDVTRTFHFDAVGRMQWSQDAAGLRTTFGVDLLGRTIETTLPLPDGSAGAVVVARHEYNAMGQLVELRDALDRVTTYRYDGMGRLIRMDSPDGTYTTTAYNGLGTATHQTDALGRAATTVYDARNRAIVQTRPDGATAIARYDSAGRMIAQVDALGHETTYEYDVVGRVTATNLPAVDIDAPQDPGSQVSVRPRTEYRYDDLGRITATTTNAYLAADGVVVYLRHDADGNTVVAVDWQTGTTQTTRYDRLGRVAAETSPDPDDAGSLDAPEVRYAYDADGNARFAYDYRGGVEQTRTEFLYDGLGRVIEQRLPAVAADADGDGVNELNTSPTVTYQYDAVGNVRFTTDALNATTEHVYDDWHRQIETIDALGNRSALAYDWVGNVVSTTDPRGEAPGDAETYTQHHEYDQLNRRTRTTDALDQDTTSAFDAVGNLVIVTSALGYATRFVYDDLNRLVTTIDPMGGRVDITHDRNGNVQTTTNALGNTTWFGYDALNRQLWAADALSGGDPGTPAAPNHASFTAYDAAGNVVAVTDASGATTSFRNDNLGRLIATTDALGNEARTTYTNLGQVATMTDPRGVATTGIADDYMVEYQYDVLGRLTRTTQHVDGGTIAAVTTYDLAGQARTTTDALGFTTRYDYDPTGRLIREVLPMVNVDGQSVTPTTEFKYDAAGNMIAVSDPRDATDDDGTAFSSHTTWYFYDPLNRVAAVMDALGQVTDGDADGVPDQPDAAHSTRTEFDADGNVVRVTDARGHSTWFGYDALGRELWRTNALADGPEQAGYTDTMSYDAVGNLLSSTDANGRTVTYTYDALNRLIQQVQPAVFDAERHTTVTPTTWFGYDAVGNRVYQADARGDAALDADHTTWFLYDDLHRQTSVIGALADDNVIDTNGDGLTDLDADTYLTSHSGARATITTYDAVGNVLSVTDPNGDATAYTYDALNRLVTETLADPNAAAAPQAPVYTYTYDENGNLIAKVAGHGDGHTTWYFYDAHNRLTHTTDPLGVQAAPNTRKNTTDPTALTYTTATDYDEAGNAIRFIDATGHTTDYTYDALNRVVTETLPDAGAGRPTTTYTYDATGNVIDVEDALGHHTWTYFDELGRAVATADAIGVIAAGANRLAIPDFAGLTHLTRTTYDAVGNVLGVTDPEGNQTAYTYDALHRLIDEQVTVDSTNLTEAVAYDAVGNRVKYTDRDGRVTGFAYNAQHRRTREQWFDDEAAYQADTPTRTFETTHDDVGRVIGITETDASGQTLLTETFVYDELGRLTQRTSTGTGTGTVDADVRYTYDDNGNLATAVAIDPSDGVTQLVYTEHQHDANARRTATLQRQGNVTLAATFSYSQDGELTQVKHFQGDATLTFADFAGPTPTATPVATSGYTFDALGRLDTLDHTTGGPAALISYDYTYDAAGRIVTLDHDRDDGGAGVEHTQGYTYDAADQLLGVDYQDASGQPPHTPSDEAYAYDRNHNRTTADAHAVTTGDHNRLTHDGTYGYLYDNAGRRSARFVDADGDGTLNAGDSDITTYQWDHRGRLIGVDHFIDPPAHATATADRSVRYTYDTTDRLIGRTLDADGSGPDAPTSESYLLDADDLWAALDSAGNVARHYLHGPLIDQVLSQHTPGSGQRVFALSDHQGTVRDLVDEAGTLLNHRVYDSFGVLTSETNPGAVAAFDFGYTGRYFDDAVALQFNEARWYDPHAGRFLSEDPAGFLDGPNRYAYVGNNPLNWVDPSGLAASWALTPDTSSSNMTPVISTDFAQNFATSHPDPLAGVYPGVVGAGVAYVPMSGPVGTATNRGGLGTGGYLDYKPEITNAPDKQPQSVAALLNPTDPVNVPINANLLEPSFNYNVAASLPSIVPTSAGVTEPSAGPSSRLGAMELVGAYARGFVEGYLGGLEIAYNTFSFGATDELGLTDTSRLGRDYDSSRVLIGGSRELLITAGTAGTGTLINSGRYAGTGLTVLRTARTAGRGYETYSTVRDVGAGVGDFRDGNYLSGTINIAGGLAGGLEIAPALGRAGKQIIGDTIDAVTDTRLHAVDPATQRLNDLIEINFRRSADAPKRGAQNLTGQQHHAVSTKVQRATETHPNLRGQYQARDPRFVTQAKDVPSHRGYQRWHRELDAEVTDWVRRNPQATPADFDAYLRHRYSQPDLIERFPNGLGGAE